MKKLSLFMMALATIAMIGCKKETKVTSIQLNKTSIELAVGESEYLKATTTPTGVEVMWFSNDTKVATVSANGKVTAVESGDAVITATAGEMTETCKVHVKSTADAKYDMNIVEYGLFGEFSDPIPGRSKEVTMTDGKKYMCDLRTISNIYAWDENVQFVEGTGLVGNGWVCCFENVPFWVIQSDGGYVGAGGFVAKSMKEGEVTEYTCNVGQLDPASYGKYVQFMYSGEEGGDLDAEYTAMREKNYGAFVSINQISSEGSEYINYYSYGLYDAHINKFIFIEESEEEDGWFAADVTWGNLDSQKYWYGFERDTEMTDKISLLTPYADHYNTVNKIYDETGYWSGANVFTPKYHVGDPAKYHKELPAINGVAPDKYKMARN